MIALFCLALLATPNLLPGDTAFTLGAGPFDVLDDPALPPPRIHEGRLTVPSPGEAGARGAGVRLPFTPALEPDRLYTFAFRARGSGGPQLEAAVTDPFGRGERGRFRVTPEWRTYQVTFTPQPVPRHAEEAGRRQVDWRRRRSVAGDPPGLARFTIELLTRPHPGPPGEVELDDLRLVPGALAAEAEPPEIDVDALWNPAGPARPAWLGDAALDIRALGPGDGRVDVTLTDPEGHEVLARQFFGDGPWTVRLDDVPAGFYRLDLTATAGDLVARRTRWLPLLRNRMFATLDLAPYLLDAGALPRLEEARALGYRRIRLVVPWSELATPAGEPDFAALDSLLAPVGAMRLEPVLAIRLTPASALPREVITAKRMDSHGYLKATPLPDLEIFSAWSAALGQRLRGSGVVYELDDEPFRSWSATEYEVFVGRFVELIGAADPTARFAGAGSEFTAPGEPKLALFFDEALKKGLFSDLARVSVSLPENLGTLPEERLTIGLAPLFDLLAAKLPADGPRVQLIDAPPVNLGPLDPAAPRLLPPEPAVELSPFQFAARLARTMLLARRVDPVAMMTGWRGGYGPREAALDHWLENYAGARFVRDLSFGEGLTGVLLELPDGKGLAAVWDPSDDRWSAADAPAEALAELRFAAPPGLLRARTLYGRAIPLRDEARLPLSFEPVYLEAATPAWLDRFLADAEVRHRARVQIAARLTVVDRRPGLALDVAAAEPVQGDVRVELAGNAELATRRFSYTADSLPPAAFVPLVDWTDPSPVRVRLLAEAGNRIVELRRTLVPWPWVTAPAPRLDGLTEDWPDEVPPLTLATGDRLTDSTVDWLGPDDASCTVRGRYLDGTLYVAVEVHDDALAYEAKDPLLGGDGVELRLDLDLAGDPFDSRFGPDDYKLHLAPIFDGVFQGRHKLLRGPGPGAALVRDLEVESRFLQTSVGYVVEAAVPLTADGMEKLRENGAFGLELVLHDDDGTGEVAHLELFGDGGGQVWPARGGWLHEPAAATPAGWLPPPPVRIGFSPNDLREPYRLLPFSSRDMAVRRAPVDDFVRGEHALRVELGEPAAPADIAAVELPGAGEWEVEIWCRATRSTPDSPATVGVRTGKGTEWVSPPADWRRFRVRLTAVAHEPLILSVDGTGVVEIAELSVRPAPTEPVREPRTGGQQAGLPRR